MSDPDKPMEEPRQFKGRRRGPVIDLKAEEVPAAPTGATVADTPSADAPVVPAEADRDSVEARTPGAIDPAAAGPSPEEPAAKVEPTPETAPHPEPLHVPPPPERKASMALPLAAAALVGLVFGGVGGTLAPMLTGGDNADAAKIAILDRTQQQLAKDQAGLASASELEKLRQALAKLEADAAQRSAAPAAGAASEQRIAQLEAELRALAARPAQDAGATAAPPAPPVDLAPLQQQVAALQQQISGLGAAEAERRELDARIKALDGQLKSLAARVEAAAQAAQNAPQAAVQAATAAFDPKLAALGQRVQQAETRIESGRAAPLFAAVQALAQAFHRGTPFATELTAAEALGAPAEQLQPLRPFAERGAPTPQRLQESFAPLAGKLAGDASQPGLWGYVSRFVTVRPTEESASGTPPAIVGSIEAALRRGDATAAAASWSRLPEPARNASAEWGALAAQRAAAAKALADLQAASAAALRK